jgi:DNA polymerase-3 subunit delta'
MTDLHPWNRDLWNSVAADRERLSHALLLSGPAGLGKRAFVERLATFLLCETPQGDQPCGSCPSCAHLVAGAHADLHVLQPEAYTAELPDRLSGYANRYPPGGDSGKRKKLKAVIGVEQVRNLIGGLQTRAHSARCKVAIITPADLMNTNSANALLKLLEEPPGDSYLLLLSHRPDRLPATIRSRCGMVDFRIPAREVALTWLEGRLQDAALLLDLAGGAPLKALELGQGGFIERRRGMIADLAGLAGGRGDPVACAARWKETGVDRALEWLQGWVMDTIRLRMAGGDTRLGNPDARQQLQDSGGTINLGMLFSFLERLSEGRRLIEGGGIDENLLLEEMLIRWSAAGRG